MKPLAAAVHDLPSAAAEARFRRLYDEHGRDILAFALRRLDDPEDAADVLAETFLVAWRRFDEVPPPPAARLWLYAVARGALANKRRGERRRRRLQQRLRAEPNHRVHPDHDPGPDDERLLAALEGLDLADQEILRLTAWEELSPSEAGRVLGLSAVAARTRLHRARRRLRRRLAVANRHRAPAVDPLKEEER